MLKRAYSNVLDFSKKLTKLDNYQTEVFLKVIIMIMVFKPLFKVAWSDNNANGPQSWLTL